MRRCRQLGITFQKTKRRKAESALDTAPTSRYHSARAFGFIDGARCPPTGRSDGVSRIETLSPYDKRIADAAFGGGLGSVFDYSLWAVFIGNPNSE